MDSRISNRILTIAVAFDILVFAIITLGAAKRNETISAAAWSTESNDKILGKIFRPIIDVLFYPIQKNHCYNAWLVENRK